MSKFMVLYQAPFNASQKMGASTPAQMKTGLAEWRAWKEKTERTGASFEFGMPLDAKRHLEPDGATSESKLKVSGYGIIEAESLEMAVGLLKDHPHLKSEGASLELLAFVSMPGL
ncbi:MAG: hypothetical protein H0X34_09955 [Chthoniobacterales bacterium]|nr:hypothetical protein [Chthoniobacterales bacterium]